MATGTVTVPESTFVGLCNILTSPQLKKLELLIIDLGILITVVCDNDIIFFLNLLSGCCGHLATV